MKQVAALHDAAMRLADEAYALRRAGDGAWLDRLREAHTRERKAALLARRSKEPLRSVLMRSAATLALECGETREAERLVGLALYGNPPDPIANELRELLDRVNFERHLAVRGIELQPNELQLALAGGSVGPGFVDSAAFVKRVSDLEKLIYRTAERRQDLDYRGGGFPGKSVSRHIGVYLSVPRAASFAISFRLGRQREFPGVSVAEDVIDDMLDCLEIFSRADLDELMARIDDPAYFNNFVGLARELAPDGRLVTGVGLTSVRDGKDRKVTIKRPPDDAIEGAQQRVLKGAKSRMKTQRVVVEGQLRFADDRSASEHGIVELLEGRKRYKIDVPSGMMSDIVRPMWGRRVRVVGYRRRPRDPIRLSSIDAVPEPDEE